MAKKKKIEDNTNYLPQLLEDIMGAGFGRYAKTIIQERALPDARDGLKPVQRRILYGMYHSGNTYDHPRQKSAKAVGLIMGNYHPHGDSSVYDAMVRMSQSWKVRLPLIDMGGNNGSMDDDPPAASRYTEVRLAKVTQVMQDDLDKDTVEMAPNFDDTEVEPTVLPVPFPVMLVNGAAGIAAGYATNMPPHNLGEVIDATVYRIQNPECSIDEIMDIMKGPDFPTGGIVQGEKGIRDAFTTGRGRVVIRSKAEIVEEKTVNQIVITEIPYEVVKSSLVRKMSEVRLNKEIDGILDVRDVSGKNGLRIEVDVRKDADAQLILNYLYKSTDLQIYYSYNNVAIVDRTPMVVGVLELLDTFINFRREVIVRRAVYEKDRKEKRCHILEGLMKAVSILDEIIYIIRHSKNKADSIRNLMKEFGFDEIQADAIVSMRLYNLTNTDIVKVREEFALLVNEIEEMRMIIENRDIQHSVMIRELRAVKDEYDTPRLTRIEREVEEIVINKEQMIVNEHVVVAASRDGYIKRVSIRSFTASKDSETGTKKGDVIIGAIECDTLDTLLLFTSSGQYIYLPVWQIDEAKWKDTGMHLNKVVRITSEEKVIAAILVKNFSTYAWIITVHDGGQIKRTPVSAWQVTKNNKTYPAMNVPSGRKMLAAFVAYESDSIALVSRNGFACRFPISDIPVTGTKSKGVKAMNLAAKDMLAGACVLKERDTGAVIMSQTGALKRIKADDIAAGTRPIKGTVICRQIKSNPSVVTGILGCAPGDEIVFMDETRKVFRATDIPLRQREAGFYSTELTENALPVTGIEECRIIDIPEGADEIVHADVENISLFEDENG